MPLYGDREIDLVLEQNECPELRKLHEGYNGILQMIGVWAREFERQGLTIEAQKERERRAELDHEYAEAMKRRAAGGT